MNNLLLPRGIRNNNPGNIRLSSTKWQGQKPLQQDASFVEFIEPVYGLRALMKLLITYYAKFQLDTVESIINRYAPPHENATDAYIHAVAKALKVGRCEKINVLGKKTLITLAKAITRHENGRPPENLPADWYDDLVYRRAASLALSSTSLPQTKGNRT